MAGLANTEQAQAWNGYEGRHWAEHQDRYDAVNAGFNEPLLTAAAIRPGEHVLDVGCGNGQTTRLAARRARPGRVLGIDLSGPMLARAGDAAAREGDGNASFVQGDAQVHPLPEGRFDVVLSRFGTMFFADPVAAFGNLARALRPGGRLAVLALRRMSEGELGPVLAAFAQAVTTEPAGRDAAGFAPVSLADPGTVSEVLGEAGFAGVRTTPVEADQYWGRDAGDAAEFLASWGPLRHRLTARPEHTGRAVQALRAAFARHEGSDGVRLRGAALLIQAVRPVSPDR
ncbi:class I SAM-dependent methyltransferase [Streptomyces rameus]|uniref:Class I SAM-dependent methyltransferase n=1 Tax=Streptomyces rameus TaxID=68261 RepID=A0ABP6NJL8_9ACTN